MSKELTVEQVADILERCRYATQTVAALGFAVPEQCVDVDLGRVAESWLALKQDNDRLRAVIQAQAEFYETAAKGAAHDDHEGGDPEETCQACLDAETAKNLRAVLAS